MRSSDLFTTIAEKSRPTATTHSRSRTEPRSQRADETAQTKPRTSPPGRAMSLVSSLVGPLPACRSDYLYRLPVSERETARLRALPRAPVPAGPRYRVSRSDAATRRDPALESGAGSGFGNSRDRGHADPGDRERDTRATRLTVTPQSRPFEAGFEALSCSWSAGSASRACQGGMPNAECAAASVYTAYQNVYVIQYKFRLHRVHARHVIHVATAATRGSTIPPRRRFARHIKDTPILTESAMCTGMGYGVV